MLSQQFLAFIKQEKLFKKKDKLILAISGGLDSVVLAYLLKSIGQTFCLAHMNFQLRGEDSEQDQHFVESLSKSLDVDLFTKRVKVESDSNRSIQMLARELRYEWFDHLLRDHKYQFILTAHHANDHLETAILNLTRGTGIKGLRAIQNKTGFVLRPLLFASREDIRNYAIENDIKWREDKSNQETKYKRNFVRHEIIPQLEQLNPQLIKNFLLSSERFKTAELALDELLTQVKKDHVREVDGLIYLKKNILKLNNGQGLLYELLIRKGFSMPQLHSFDFDRVGATLKGEKYVLNVDREEYILSSVIKSNTLPGEIRLPPESYLLDLPELRLTIEEEKGSQWEFQKSNYIVRLDKDQLGNDLILRNWQEGDKFQPLGMKGQKKVSDYLIDRKVPLTLKKEVLVLVSGKEIVWLIGHEINDNFKITSKTKNQLKINIDFKKPL